MSPPYFPKPICIATRWQTFKARIFGRRIATKQRDGITIYVWRGIFYVTEI